MSYSSNTLSVLGYANGFTLWHYSTPDAAKQVAAPGYLNAATEMLRPGDFIMVNAGRDSESPKHGVLVVASNKNGQVTLADMGLLAADAESLEVAA